MGMPALLRLVLQTRNVPNPYTSLFGLVGVWCETELSRESCLLFPLLLLQLAQSDTEFVSLGAQIGPIGLRWLFVSFICVVCHRTYSTPQVSTHNCGE
jgi:hypothetical protein